MSNATFHDSLVDDAVLSADPIALFRSWFEAARKAGALLPEAMTLATSSPDGRPAARSVLLKEIDAHGFVFFTNYGSRKSRDLAVNPRAALLFHWAPLERQVRIEGRTERLPTKDSAAYFRTRPLGSRLGAWASRQSEELPSRATLDDRVQRIRERFGDDPPVPPFWGGYRVIPTVLEFWQGRPDRLHDRVEFLRDGPAWTARRLYP